MVNARLLDFERELQAEKRGGTQVAQSLDAPLAEGEDAMTLHDTVPDRRQPEVLIEALKRAGANLTDRQQGVVQALNQGDSKVDAARRLGIHRDTLYQELKRIQQVFRDEGLEEFLR